MTKTYTEQWREGTLPDGYYYIDYDTQQKIFEIEDGCATYQGLPAETYFLNDVCLIKVLGPVPSYTELTLMAGNYRLAKKALRDCYNEMKYWATMNHRCSKIFNHIKAALVEIEEVK